MTDHQHGFFMGISGMISAGVIWFLRNIQVIDGVMQFVLLAISIGVAIAGARKVFKK